MSGSYQVLIVQQMDHACRPVPHGHQVGRCPVQSQQAQGGALLHTVHGVSEVHAKDASITPQPKSCALLLTVSVHLGNFGFFSSGSGLRTAWEFVCVHAPCHQDDGNLGGKGLGHFSAAHVSDAVQGQVHEGRVAAWEVILNAVVDQPNQVAVGVHQHRDEQVALRENAANTDTFTGGKTGSNTLFVKGKGQHAAITDLQSVSPYTCWNWGGWRPPCVQSRCHVPEGR